MVTEKMVEKPRIIVNKQ